MVRVVRPAATVFQVIYRVVVPSVVVVVTVLLVMQQVVLQMLGGAAVDATVHGNGPLLGLLVDLVKKEQYRG